VEQRGHAGMKSLNFAGHFLAELEQIHIGIHSADPTANSGIAAARTAMRSPSGGLSPR
jgi:hypothetical protein